MEPTEAIAFVRYYNAWRRGDDSVPMPHPEDIGRALDALCHHAERLKRELEQEHQDRKQADLDCLRALGERNDERALADRLAEALENATSWDYAKPTLDAWKEARE